MEDCDYEWRCKLADVPTYFIEGTTTHYGSAAIRSDERLNLRNRQTYPANVRRYVEKWGGPQRGGEIFTTPFDKGGWIGDWRTDLRIFRDQRW
jgi:hypothetical protein